MATGAVEAGAAVASAACAAATYTGSGPPASLLLAPASSSSTEILTVSRFSSRARSAVLIGRLLDGAA
jgi:hypothetical protein